MVSDNHIYLLTFFFYKLMFSWPCRVQKGIIQKNKATLWGHPWLMLNCGCQDIQHFIDKCEYSLPYTVCSWEQPHVYWTLISSTFMSLRKAIIGPPLSKNMVSCVHLKCLLIANQVGGPFLMGLQAVRNGPGGLGLLNKGTHSLTRISFHCLLAWWSENKNSFSCFNGDG